MRIERRAGGFAAAVGLLALAVAWIAEHRLLMAPCALCLMERWPYRAMFLLGLLAVVLPRAGRAVLGLIALSLAAAILVSLAHVGVEQGWWPDPWPACMAPQFHGGSFAERLASMPRHPVKPCDSPNRLFNMLPASMATLDLVYAVLISALFALIVRSRRTP